MEIPYEKTVEDEMKNFYDSLSEKNRRRYAAIEVRKLAYGAKQYISTILDCDYKTIERGLLDLKNEAELKKNEYGILGEEENKD